MESKLKTWELKVSDLLLMAWGFVLVIFLSSQFNWLINKYIANETLRVLGSGALMQFLLVGYVLVFNKYFKFALFKFHLSCWGLIINALKYFAIGLGVVFSVNLLTNILMNALGINLEPQAAVELLQSTNGIAEKSLAILSAVIFAPIAEELLFRGLLYRILKSRMPMLFAMIASSLIFSLIHFSIFAFIPLFLFALILCFIYEKFEDIRLCVLVHCFFNLFNTILLILVS